MTNKEKLTKAINGMGYELGCYRNAIESLAPNQLKKILEGVKYGNTDIKVSMKRTPHIVEISYVDNEIDFNIMTLSDYENQYGRKFEE